MDEACLSDEIRKRLGLIERPGVCSYQLIFRQIPILQCSGNHVPQFSAADDSDFLLHHIFLFNYITTIRLAIESVIPIERSEWRNPIIDVSTSSCRLHST